jgi:hypothetical protein
MKAKERAKTIASSILHFTWTQSLLYWIILSAGTMSECAFLVASMWMSENSAAHDFVRKFMSEDMTKNVSYFATAAYVGLPVAILPLGILTVIKHARTWHYEKKRVCAPAVWCILYGLPTLVFLTLDIITVACSVLAVNFELPPALIVARALSAYTFALVALLYMQLGKPQEADRLKEKDLFIDQLQEQVRLLKVETESLVESINQQKQSLVEHKAAQKRLIEEMQKSDDDALQAYGQDCINWLRSGAKSVLVADIISFTGHSKKKINNALKSGDLQVSPRNRELVLVSSLVEWLKNTPPPTSKERNTGPLPVSSNGHENETVNLNDFPELLV